jgi:hypothetical protein
MQRLEESRKIFVSSCVITVHSKANMMSNCRTYLLPNEIDMETLQIEASPDSIGHQVLWKLKNEEQEQEHMFDSIFAQVQGVEAGLLPTEEQIGTLAQTIENTCVLWVGSGWSTDQPKWQLFFDCHLVDQVRMFWGLADKLDDVIEKAH